MFKYAMDLAYGDAAQTRTLIILTIPLTPMKFHAIPYVPDRTG